MTQVSGQSWGQTTLSWRRFAAASLTPLAWILKRGSLARGLGPGIDASSWLPASRRDRDRLPDASTATSTTSASVTFTRSPFPLPQRSASTSTRTVIEVRPTRAVSVKKLTMSPTKTGSWNSTSRIALVT